MSELRLQGIGVSRGTRIGKAFIYLTAEKEEVQAEETITEAEVADVLARVDQAKQQSFDELENIIRTVKKTVGENEASIIQAQQAFLNDPAFFPEIIKNIRVKKFTAEKSVKQVVAQFVNIFLAMKDEYLRERATDLQDLERRLLKHLNNNRAPELTDIREEVILVAKDLTPSDTVQINKEYIQAFITQIGGKQSHTAILARTMEIPAIVGMGKQVQIINQGDVLIIDGLSGICIVNPDKKTLEGYRKQIAKEQEEQANLAEYITKQARTIDGYLVEIATNIGNPEEAELALAKGAEAIGLYRTEFLFMENNHLPTEEEQYRAYRKAAETMSGKAVIIRTLDIGGDKELDYLSIPRELNPFLGYRAIRLTLDRRELFLTQLRAILRASSYGKIKIMFPMISNLQELSKAKEVLAEAKQQLSDEGIEYAKDIEIGIMIEVPSAALIADRFAKEVDFFSIGTNDLVQYTLAVDRMNEKVAYLYDYFHPAVLQLIKMTIEASKRAGKWSGMCGGMAGDPLAVPVLIGLGLDEWSMDAGSMLKIKQLITKLSKKDCEELTAELLQLGTAEEIKSRIRQFYKENKIKT